MILDRYRLGQLRKSWYFRTSSLPLPSVVAVDHPLIRKKRSPIPRTGLAGSQAERNENGTERKKDGTELKRCENAVKRSHRRTIVRRSSVNIRVNKKFTFRLSNVVLRCERLRFVPDETVRERKRNGTERSENGV